MIIFNKYYELFHNINIRRLIFLIAFLGLIWGAFDAKDFVLNAQDGKLLYYNYPASSPPNTLYFTYPTHTQDKEPQKELEHTQMKKTS